MALRLIAGLPVDSSLQAGSGDAIRHFYARVLRTTAYTASVRFNTSSVTGFDKQLSIPDLQQRVALRQRTAVTRADDRQSQPADDIRCVSGSRPCSACSHRL